MEVKPHRSHGAPHGTQFYPRYKVSCKFIPQIKQKGSRGVNAQRERGAHATMTVSKKYNNAKLGVSFHVSPASSAPEPGPVNLASVHDLE